MPNDPIPSLIQGSRRSTRSGSKATSIRAWSRLVRRPGRHAGGERHDAPDRTGRRPGRPARPPEKVRDLGVPLLSVDRTRRPPRDMLGGRESESRIERRRRGGTAMSHSITDHLAPDRLARITGGCYLAFILTSVLADRLGHIGLGSAQQVYQSVVTDPTSFRLALVVGLISAFLFLVTAWGLYVLLRPVNKRSGAALPAAQHGRCRHPVREHVPAALRAADGRRGQPHAGLLGGAAGGAGAPVRRRVQGGLRHGAAVLRHVAVPARLPGLQVRQSFPAFLGVLLMRRRRRRPRSGSSRPCCSRPTPRSPTPGSS